MVRQPVSSSNLRSVGYDPGASILEIEFQDGSVYQYFEVPSKTYAGLMRADSKGSYLHENIKDQFRYEKL